MCCVFSFFLFPSHFSFFAALQTQQNIDLLSGSCVDDLRPSEVVRQTIPDPAEQAPLVARSVTPPSPSGRGGTTLLRQRAPRSCTVFVMTPSNEHTSEGGRDDRGVPYHAESTLSSAQVLSRRSAPRRGSGTISALRRGAMSAGTARQTPELDAPTYGQEDSLVLRCIHLGRREVVGRCKRVSRRDAPYILAVAPADSATA